jgi:hypothetical protein
MGKKEMRDSKHKHGGKNQNHHGKNGGHKNGDMMNKHHKNGHHGHNGHHDRDHMTWCLAIGAVLYTAMIVTFASVFRVFFYHYNKYHTLREMHKQSSNLSIAERNKKFVESKSPSAMIRKAIMIRQKLH